MFAVAWEKEKIHLTDSLLRAPTKGSTCKVLTVITPDCRLLPIACSVICRSSMLSYTVRDLSCSLLLS